MQEMWQYSYFCSKRWMWVNVRISSYKHQLFIFQNTIKEINCIVIPFLIWAATWKNRIFAYAKTKTQISFAVTAKLISVFVFPTRIVQSLFFLNPKFPASSHLKWLPSPVYVGSGRKPRRPVFSERGSYMSRDVRKPVRGFRPGPTQTGCTITEYD